MKKKTVLRWALGLLLTPVVLLLLLVVLVYLPPVQGWLAQRAAAIASEQTGLDISVGRVRLAFPLDLELADVLVVQQGDTVASVATVVADVQLWPLLDSRVVVDRLTIGDARLNTLDLLPDLHVEGRVGSLKLASRGIDLHHETLSLDGLRLSDTDLLIALSDTAAQDTTASEPTQWLVTFDEIDIQRTRLRFAMAPTEAMAYMGHATIGDGHLDLGSGSYRVGYVTWADGQLAYDDTSVAVADSTASAALDANHLRVGDLQLRLDSLHYDDTMLHATLTSGALTERSGLSLTQAHADVALDGEQLTIDSLLLQTPYSRLTASAQLDLAALADTVAPAPVATATPLRADMALSLGRGDLQLALGDALPAAYPQWPLDLRATIGGSASLLRLERLSLTLPTVVQADVRGTIAQPLSAVHRQADLTLDVQAYKTAPLLQLADLSPATLRLPAGLRLDGDITMRGDTYGLRLTARDADATARVDAHLDATHMAYDVTIDAAGLNLSRYMPALPVTALTATADVRGRGTDPFSSATKLDARATVSRLQYDAYRLDSITATATMADGHLDACLESHNSLLDAMLALNATVDRHSLRATVVPDIRRADLGALGLTDDPLVVGLTGHADVVSDLDQRHSLATTLTDITLHDAQLTYHPEDLTLALATAPDTLGLRMQSGNLVLRATAPEGYDRLLGHFTTLADTLAAQLDRQYLDQSRLKLLLPTLALHMDCGRKNPLADILRAATGVDFSEGQAHIDVSPLTGINGDAHLYRLRTDALQLDTLRLSLRDSGRGLTFQASVENNRKNPQLVFRATLDGMVYEHGLYAGVHYYDAQGTLGARIGAKATLLGDGVNLTLMPERPLLGYKEFALNADNYIMLSTQGRLTANVDLVADDGTGLKLYSTSQDSTLTQDVTLSVNHIDLGQLTATLPMLPAVGGLVDGDFHITTNQQGQLSLAADMNVAQLAYEGALLGNIGAELVYMQREDDTHAINGTLLSDGQEIGMLEGEYRGEGDGAIDATLSLMHTPLALLNGFFPDQMLSLSGYIDGELAIAGPLSTPLIDGQLTPDSACIASPPYGVRLYLDPEPIEISQSRLLLDNLALYTSADRQAPNAINMRGSVDFADTDAMTIDLGMRATDCQLINARQTATSVAYGKMFVSFGGRIRGTADALQVRGRLNVLGTTDLTYLLLDSPLSTDNQLDELVRFTDFADSTANTVVTRPTPGGLSADLTVSIDEQAHVKCALNADQSNYVDLYGGGDLRLRMAGDDLTMTGRYTLSSGSTMKYSLPVIPLKTFTIQDGSFVEFTGDPANPRLSLTATERVRTNVTADDGSSRTVAFDCGVVISKTLADMGLSFTITAPEDLTISSQLASLSDEQRGKLAVTMLTTGMYLADGNTSGFSMNSALSSFLQSEINNITSGALKTIDLQVGLDNTTDATGATRTDYSFSFAKRFWNNRLSVKIGGKVSTGAEVQGQNQSFFDNVTMEYRLSPTSNQYVKLFYNQNAYDWLDGYTGEYGGGYIWKRKFSSLADLFHNTSPAPVSVRRGSTAPVPTTSPQDTIPAP